MAKSKVRWAENGRDCEGVLTNEDPFIPKRVMLIEITGKGERIRFAKELAPDTYLYPTDGPIPIDLRFDAENAGYKLGTYESGQRPPLKT
jgi:hypothetical protein